MSNWFDAMAKTSRETPAAHALFKRIMPVVRHGLTNRLLMEFSATGGRRPTRDIWYSEGARKFLLDGGELVSWTPGVRYILPEAPNDSAANRLAR